MKKLLAAIVATALMGLGLVAVSSQPASAACPYTACINTATSVRTPAQKRAGKSVPIKVIVTAPGNVVPRGTVKVEVFRYGKKKYTSNLPYAGGQITFVTQTLKRGVHVVNVTFTPDPGSVWNASSASTTFKIKKKKKKKRR